VTPRVVLVVAGAVAVLFALHLLATWAEARGWIYYRKGRGRNWSVGTAAEELQSLLQPLCERQRKPLLAGWPAGHGAPNRPLPLGLHAVLDADAGTLTLNETLLHGPARPAAPPVQAAK